MQLADANKDKKKDAGEVESKKYDKGKCDTSI